MNRRRRAGLADRIPAAQIAELFDILEEEGAVITILGPNRIYLEQANGSLYLISHSTERARWEFRAVARRKKRDSK